MAVALLDAAGPLIRERGITLVGVALTGPVVRPSSSQFALPLDHPDHGGLDEAVDAVAMRFGTQAVMRASLLRRGEGIAVPLLPDA